jgi:hypothetical protein
MGRSKQSAGKSVATGNNKGMRGFSFGKEGFIIVNSYKEVNQGNKFNTLSHPLIIHEGLHQLTGGFRQTRLEEGMTELLTAKITERHAVEYEMRFIAMYHAEQEAISLIRDRFAELTGSREKAMDMLTRAYITGDTTELQKTIGANNWARIEYAASKFNNEQDQDKLRENYIPEIKGVLNLTRLVGPQ